MGRIKKNLTDKELSFLIKNISIKIKTYRQELNKSQLQLSKEAKISLSTLNEIENMVVSDLRLSTIVALAKALERKPIELLTDSDLQLNDPDKNDLERAAQIITKLRNKLCQ